jgi:hypothetical protein
MNKEIKKNKFFQCHNFTNSGTSVAVGAGEDGDRAMDLLPIFFSTPSSTSMTESTYKSEPDGLSRITIGSERTDGLLDSEEHMVYR